MSKYVSTFYSSIPRSGENTSACCCVGLIRCSRIARYLNASAQWLVQLCNGLSLNTWFFSSHALEYLLNIDNAVAQFSSSHRILPNICLIAFIHSLISFLGTISNENQFSFAVIRLSFPVLYSVTFISCGPINFPYWYGFALITVSNISNRLLPFPSRKSIILSSYQYFWKNSIAVSSHHHAPPKSQAVWTWSCASYCTLHILHIFLDVVSSLSK